MSSEEPNAADAAKAEVAAKHKTLFTIFVTVFIDLIGFSIIFPLFPDMLVYYGENEAESSFFAWSITKLEALSDSVNLGAIDSRFALLVLFGGILGSLYSTLQFIFSPIWGRLSDRMGRRPVLLITVAGIGVSYAIWVFSGSFLLLLASRVLGGLMSGNIAVASAAIADVTSAKNRARGMAIIGIAFGLGFTLGPALSGLLLAKFNLAESYPALAEWGFHPFSVPAAGALFLSLFNLFLVVRYFPETRPAEQRDQQTVERTNNPLALFHVSGVPGANLANWVYFIYFLAFSAMEFTLVFLAHERLQYTPADNGLMFCYIGILMALVQGGVVRRLAPRLGDKKVALAGIFLTIPGFLITAAVTDSSGMLYLGLGFLACGSALVTPCLSSLVSLYAPDERRGALLGTFRSLGALARAVGPIIGCGLYWQLGSSAPYIGGGRGTRHPVALGDRVGAAPAARRR